MAGKKDTDKGNPDDTNEDKGYWDKMVWNEYYKIKKESIDKIISSYEEYSNKPEYWRNPPTQPKAQVREKHKAAVDSKFILEPFESVFFPPNLLDDLVVRISIPQVIEGKLPLYPGVILFGPPGTGKSEFQRAACESFQRAGAYSNQVSSSTINSCYVGELAKNIERELRMANDQGEKTGLPALLSFDEGSIFAQRADVGSSNVSKHYQEAIDVFKRFLGNEPGKWLVLAISTNSLPEDFEDAMTREGRLNSVFIPYPSKEEIGKMWNYFMKKYDILNLKEEEPMVLAELTANQSGAFIEQFCRAYHSIRRNSILHSKGYATLLDALRHNANVTEEEIKASINFEVFINDIIRYLTSKKANGKGKNDDKGRIGFGKE